MTCHGPGYAPQKEWAFATKTLVEIGDLWDWRAARSAPYNVIPFLLPKNPADSRFDVKAVSRYADLTPSSLFFIIPSVLI